MLVFWVYLEEYIQKCIGGMVLGMFICCIGFAFDASKKWREEWRNWHFAVGALIAFSSIFTLSVEVHILEGEEETKLISPLYTHVIAKGEKIEQKDFRTRYETYYSRYDVHTDHLYILTNKDVYEIFDKYGSEMAIFSQGIEIAQRDFGHGELDFIISTNGKEYDLWGHELNQPYSPFVINTTPNFVGTE